MFVQFISSLFSNVYNLLTSVNVPGFNFNFFQLYTGIFVISILLIVLNKMLGVGSGGGLKAGGLRSNGKLHISKEREGDTK